MSFTRTNSGISNLRLFYNADIIVFTEGGSHSFSIDDVNNGLYNNHSVDIKFWSHIFKSNEFERKIEFRAIGSKTASKFICEKIMKNEIKNIAVAKDRDLDQYLGDIMDSPFILYTKGYSWENDVFVKELTIAQVESMILSEELSQEIIDGIENAYQDFRSYGKHLAKLEVIFRYHGIKFISDINGERFFNAKNGINIDKNQVNIVLNEKKKDITRPLRINLEANKICPMLNNYGKLLEAFSLHIINYFCKKYADYKSIPKQIIVSAMLERFSQKNQIEKDSYYFNIIERLKSS